MIRNVLSSALVILRYSEGSLPSHASKRSFGVPQDDERAHEIITIRMRPSPLPLLARAPIVIPMEVYRLRDLPAPSDVAFRDPSGR